jgi:hypothetical protein
MHNQKTRASAKTLQSGASLYHRWMKNIKIKYIYTTKHLPNRGPRDFRDKESLQSNLACTPLSYATLILLGSRQGVAGPLNAELACAGFPGESRTRRGFHEKNQYRRPSRAGFRPGHPYFAINEWGEVSTTLFLLHSFQQEPGSGLRRTDILENTIPPPET